MYKDMTEYQHCVEKLKSMAGIRNNTKSIREALRDNSFHDTIQQAVHCPLMDHWPLAEQQRFLAEISAMSEAEKRVHIYATAYELYKLDRLSLV